VVVAVLLIVVGPAHHVLGVLTPIVRSLTTTVTASGFTVGA
jgi:hypothetical protein